MSSSTSLATSSNDSDNNLNKENDYDLINEFNNSLKTTTNFLINQNVISDQLKDQLNNKNDQNNKPKPPSRIKSTSKLNKIQRDNVNSSSDNTQNLINCSTIKIKMNGENDDEQAKSVNSSKIILNNNLKELTNKLTINVQANDKQLIKLEQELEQVKDANQLESDKSELILNGQQTLNGITSNFESASPNNGPSTAFSSHDNGLWSSSDLNSSKSKHTIKQLNNNQLATKNKELQNFKSIKQQTEFVKKPINESKLPVKNNFPDKTRLDRSLDESINKLVGKSINRLADKIKFKNALADDELIRNRSCSSLACSLLSNSEKNQLIKKSRIPYSKSSVTLNSYRQTDRFYETKKVLTDNCLEVSSTSSSSCSLCTSISEDSLESKKESNHSSSLNDLNSSLAGQFDFSHIKTSNSISKINQRLDLISSNRRSLSNLKNTELAANQFKDGTRSLTSLTHSNLIGFNNRRSLKLNSNLFNHELSRIDESFDDDQQELKQKENLDQDKLNSNWLDFKVESKKDDVIAKLTNNNASQTDESNKTFSLISSSSLDNELHGMAEASSDKLMFDTSINLSTNTLINTSNNNASINRSNTSSRTSLNQFKSSVINQLIDSNSHLKDNLCFPSKDVEIDRLELANKLESSKRLDEDKFDDDEILNNEIQKNIFSNKKLMFAKNRSLISKDSCKSFELNERIVDLEMQLASNKTKFKDSINLIKLLSDHCNDLIDIIYNLKTNEINSLKSENLHLKKLNDEFKCENLNLNETCNDLKKLLNDEFDQICKRDYLDQNLAKSTEANQTEAFKELEERYDKMKNALDFARENEQQLNSELNNLKLKFNQNSELYERVKLKSLEKIERYDFHFFSEFY